MLKQSANLSLRIRERTKKFIKKRAKKFGSIKKYHLELYRLDGHKITSEDL